MNNKNILIEESITLFLSYCQKEKRRSSYTLTAYKKDLIQLQDFLPQSTCVSSLTPDDIRDFTLQEKQLNKKTSSQQRMISVLKSWCNFLYQKNYLIKNVGKFLQYPKNNQSLSKVIPKNILTNLLDNTDSSNNKNNFISLRTLFCIELLYGSGLRISEAQQLSWKNIEARHITVLGKGNKVRQVPTTKSFLALQQKYKPAYQEITPLMNNSPVFINSKGTRITTRMLQKNITEQLKQNSPQYSGSAHSLRHSFATHLLDNGADLMAIKELLGHSNLSTTQKYTKISIKKLRETIQNKHPRGE